MMKPRISNRTVGEQAMSNRMNKQEQSVNGPSIINNIQRNQTQLNNQQANAQARKRRSSINVYDQPSSLNSRLRQLETDMLRLDEDRTKLFDDTHSALAQSELKLNEIHAILKSRQDNVEKYVEDMKALLQAKEEFEKQAKLLNEKHVSLSCFVCVTIIEKLIILIFFPIINLSYKTHYYYLLLKTGPNSREIYAQRDNYFKGD